MGRGCQWRAEVTASQSLRLTFCLSSQQSLLRQQERVEERVQEIEEQLCKLDSDKCVVEVCFYTLLLLHEHNHTHFQKFSYVLV